MTMMDSATSSSGSDRKLSKRQKRAAGSNPSTTWQQQPRIKSAGARARAYVTYAGLNDDDGSKKKTSGNSSKKAEDLLNPQLDLHSPEVKFGRLLGGTDQRSRHGAVKMLREYLRARSDISTGAGLSELDLLKLWKGLWYTLYMADKVPVQDKLSKVLAELMWCLSGTDEEDEYAGQVYMQMTDMEEGEGENGVYEDEDGDTMQIIEMDDEENDDDEENENTDKEHSTDDEAMEGEEDEDEEDGEELRIQAMNEPHCRGVHLVSLYVSTFLSTVRREWGNVDKHRVDKFYTAVRYMISEAYKYMSKRHWNLGVIRLFNDVIFSEGLSFETPGLTNGLRYHLIDICVDELAKVNAKAELPLTEATLLDCLEPFFALAQRAEDKHVQKRVMDKVLLKFLNEYSFVSPIALMDDDEADEDDDAKALIFNQAHVGTVSKFIFEVASDTNTDERYRKSLYEMHKTYVRQTRAAGKDVDLDQHLEEEEEEEQAEAEASDVFIEEKVIDDEKTGTEKETDAASSDKKVDAEETKTDNNDETTTTSEKKKKKRKKKKSKGDKEVAKDAAKDDVLETPTKPSKKEKASEEVEEKSEEVSTRKTRSSSKKKRKKQQDDESESTEKESASATKVEDVKTPTPKSKKKKQKSQSPPAVDPRSMHSPDKMISPSNSDNELAESGMTAMELSASKRVSFGKMNHCKSHKASMKAMKTLDKDRWDTTSRTPDKGILQTRIGLAAEAKLKKKKKRKSSDKKKAGKPPLAPVSSRQKKGKK